MTERGIKMSYIRHPITEDLTHHISSSTHIRRGGDASDIRHAMLSKAVDEERLYYSCARYLEHPEARRMILYFPLKYLLLGNSIVSLNVKNAYAEFRNAYMEAWLSLLHTYDVRENFHLGDIYEPDARQNSDHERVVKCAHLTPWLLKGGFLKFEELVSILETNQDDPILLQSFKDTWQAVKNNNNGSTINLNMGKLLALTSKAPERKRSQPLYTSKKRAKWLAERSDLNDPKHHSDLLTPGIKLADPFHDAIEALSPKLTEIARHLAPHEIVLVGGSQLKGYGTLDSDLDIVSFDELKKDPVFYPGSPDSAHLYLNSVWVGGIAATEPVVIGHLPTSKMDIIREQISDLYIYSPERAKVLERLESDLCQYRLLHKGFQRFTGKTSFYPMQNYAEMDSDCPFYDDDYRKIATALYVKYVRLPTIEYNSY